MNKLEHFLSKAKLIYPNEEYDYSLVEYKDKDTDVKIKCNMCNTVFEQTPSNHYKHGCWNCHFNHKAKNNSNNGAKGVRLTQSEIVYKFVSIHGNNYDYSLVEYKNNKTKVKIKCNTCEAVFEQTPVNHLKGKGCRQCYINGLKTKPEDIIAKFKEINKDSYDYSLVEYVNIDTDIKIKCNKCNNIFEQSPYLHSKGAGCSDCSNRVSKAELDIRDYLKLNCGHKIVSNSRKILPSGMELDIYIPKLKLAIEYCGLYYHRQQKLEKDGFGSYYHYDKLEECEKLGIKLITIFEDEWLHKTDIVKSKLSYEIKDSNINTIYARKCEVREIDSTIKNKALDVWHLQGRDVTASISLGLYYEEELVSVITFGRPNASGGSKTYEWNLSRFACKRYTSVVGGFSKLLKHFIKNYDPKSIQTFADRRWSQGNLYVSNSFSVTHKTKPNYWYIKNQKREHRFGYRKQELSRKLKHYDPTKTEYQNMLDNISNGTGRDRIWDCGNMAFEMILN
jgi:hypothetical protein